MFYFLFFMLDGAYQKNSTIKEHVKYMRGAPHEVIPVGAPDSRN
jgi:hypothetical protein